MTSGKILTISIAAYNMEDYLEDALKSCLILDCYLEKLEIIVIDDGSADGTWEIAKRYSNLYPGIIKAVTKDNGGYGTTVSTGISLATGTYFKLLDADDRLNTANLQRHVRELLDWDREGKLPDLIMSGKEVEALEGVTAPDKMNIHIPEYIPDYWDSSRPLAYMPPYWCMHMMTVRTDILRLSTMEYPEHCLYTDALYVLAALSGARDIYYCKYTLYIYNLGRDGQSMEISQRIKHCGDMRKVLEMELDYLPTQDLKNDMLRRIVINHIAGDARFLLKILLSVGYNSGIADKIRELENYIADKSEEVYTAMNDRPFMKVLRFADYRLIWLCHINELRKIHGERVRK